ncbi:MAG: cyclic-di-AMP receptor [Acutalibacteraceae bacterium]
MKLIIAIVNDDDAFAVGNALLQNGYPATKMASAGGFLNLENTTFLLGVDEDRVDGVLELIKLHSSRRMQLMGGAGSGAEHGQVTVGGATVFVLDVDRFEKM